MRLCLLAVLLAMLLGLGSPAAHAQATGGPPSVGVVRVQKQPITETSEFVGRIQATDRVNLVARVTAFLEERLFTEGAEVKKGDLLYVLEQPPFQADLAAKQAAVQQMQAQLHERHDRLWPRRRRCCTRPPASNPPWTMRAPPCCPMPRRCRRRRRRQQQSQINLDYTEIRAPIGGKIGRTAVTVGNVVSPGSGTLATIVSQDPMYVVFPVSVRTVLELRDHYADKGGFTRGGRSGSACRTGACTTRPASSISSTIRWRPPPTRSSCAARLPTRRLADGTDRRAARTASWWMASSSRVLLEGVQPVELLAVPRAAVLSDQQGDYVYTVGCRTTRWSRRACSLASPRR